MLRKLRSYDAYELVDAREIAERFRISPGTVIKISYSEEHSFPEPRLGRGGTRQWQWYEVLEWYETHRVLRGPSGSHVPQKENRYRNHNRAYRRAD